MLSQQPLFISGTHDYHTFRIPALAVTQTGRILAFAEGRVHSSGDAGEIELVLRTSDDNGETWSNLRMIVREDDMTCGNPCPVVDQDTGTIWLWLSKNLADGGEGLITQGQAPRTVWLCHSEDNGETWSTPVDMTDQVKQDNWTWYATGPGHGIQLRSGRLLVPCDHMVGIHFDRGRDPYHSHVLYSDDHGQSWHIGGVVRDGTNECEVVELSNGDVMINCRNYVGGKRRAVSTSRDGGLTFGEFFWDETLIEPICQASILSLSDPDQTLVFANPASTERENLTIRLSTDNGITWLHSQVLHRGPAAYSDLAQAPDGSVLCLYEQGAEWPYETITLARFNATWIRSA